MEAMQRLDSKLDRWTTELQAKIDELREELGSSVKSLQGVTITHENRLKELEDSEAFSGNTISDLKSQVTHLASEVKSLREKCDEMEGRQRRNNIRLIGLPEGIEGPNITDFVARLLEEYAGTGG